MNVPVALEVISPVCYELTALPQLRASLRQADLADHMPTIRNQGDGLMTRETWNTTNVLMWSVQETPLHLPADREGRAGNRMMGETDRDRAIERRRRNRLHEPDGTDRRCCDGA